MSNAELTRAQYVDFVQTAGLGVLATVDADGRPEAALVDLAVTDDGDLLFDSKVAARKVANLAANDRVALVVGFGRVSLQIEGPAELLVGADRAALAPLYTDQCPTRPAMTDEFALFRVRPDWLRVYRTRPGQPPQLTLGVPE